MKRLILLSVLAVAAVATVGLFFLDRAASPPRDGIAIERVDDHPLYVMHLNEDYGFDQFLKKGIRPMVDIYYLGFTGKGEIPVSDRERLREAAFIPFDGMNEKGLAVGMMAIGTVKPDYDPSKVTLSSLNLIRLMLDYAQNVDEALAVLQNFNVDFTGGPTIHYLLADRSGHSAIVEYRDSQSSGGGILVLKNDRPWQVSTNFSFSLEQPQGANSSCPRFNRAYETLAQANGKQTPGQAMAMLQQVSQSSSSRTSMSWPNTPVQAGRCAGRYYPEIWQPQTTRFEGWP